MLEKIFKASTFAVVFYAQSVFCQTNDLQQLVHENVEHYGFNVPTGKKWEDVKNVLANYTQEELARALIAELKIDRGNPLGNRARDNAVRKLYKALDLSQQFICQELATTQSPREKASLIDALYGTSNSESTNALLRQLKDRRPAVEFDGDGEEETHALRVCDVACNVLSHNLQPEGQIQKIGYRPSDSRRDEIIQETLKELKLSTP